MIVFLHNNVRWLAGAFLLTFFSTLGQTSFIGGSAGHIRNEYGLSNGQWGLIYMAGTLGSALTLPYLGQIVDRWSARKVVLFVLPMLALAGALLAFAHHVVLLVLTIYLLRLFGQGMTAHTAYTTTARWFSAQRGKALSLVILGHNAGEAVLISGFSVIALSIGWRNAWLLAAIIVVVAITPLVAKLVSVEREPQAGEVNHRVVNARDWTRAEVLRDPLFYMFMLAFMAPGFIITVIFFHQVYLADLRGWPPGLFASAFIVWAVVNSVFTLISGQLIDRFSGLIMLPFVLIPLGCSCLLLGFADAAWAPFAFMALVASSSAMVTTLSGAVWPEMYGLKHIGSIRALAASAYVLASAAGPGLTGYLIDAGVSYPSQIVVMGLYCFAASAVLLIVSQRARARNRNPSQ